MNVREKDTVGYKLVGYNLKVYYEIGGEADHRFETLKKAESWISGVKPDFHIKAFLTFEIYRHVKEPHRKELLILDKVMVAKDKWQEEAN